MHRMLREQGEASATPFAHADCRAASLYPLTHKRTTAVRRHHQQHNSCIATSRDAGQYQVLDGHEVEIGVYSILNITGGG